MLVLCARVGHNRCPLNHENCKLVCDSGHIWAIPTQNHLSKWKSHSRTTCLWRSLESVLKRLAQFLGLVLDAGCGGNISARRLTSKVLQADVRIDIRNPIVRIRDFIRASICYLPFAENAFAESIASHVLEHLHDLDQVKLAIHELRRTSYVSRIFLPTWYAFGNASSEHKLVFISRRFHKFPRVIELILAFLWLPLRNRYSHRLVKPLLEGISQEHYICLEKWWLGDIKAQTGWIASVGIWSWTNEFSPVLILVSNQSWSTFSDISYCQNQYFISAQSVRTMSVQACLWKSGLKQYIPPILY